MRIKRTIRSKSGTSYDEPLQVLLTGDDAPGGVEQTGPEYDIQEAERFARDLLRKAGLPTELVSERGFITKLVEGRELEPEWHAANILFYAHAVREHIRNNNARDTFYAASRMVRHVERAYLAINEHAILVGRAQINSGKESQEYDATTRNAWRERALPLFSAGWTAKAVAKELTRNNLKAFHTCKNEIADLNPRRRAKNKGPVSPS